MDNLFEIELPKSLNLRRNISVRSQTTTQKEFDLEDKRNQNIILLKGSGDATYENTLGKELYILDFEHLRNQFNPCAILDNEGITKKCDYFITDKESICIFNEITTGNDIESLEKEIKNNKGDIEFKGGKFEKGQYQLLHSIKVVEKCSTIWNKISSFSTKICLFSYKLANSVIDEQNAFNRALEFENNEGTIYSNSEIEELGFEYRRIGYVPFKIS